MHGNSMVTVTSFALQKFGAYASSVLNTIPTSRGFDFYTYANQDPYSAEPGNEPDADKFNARAARSFEFLLNRAKRLEKLVRSRHARTHAHTHTHTQTHFYPLYYHA